MAAPVDDRLAGSALVIDRALRIIEEGAHALRQKLLARRLARSIPPEFLVPQASHEQGLSAEDLRQHAAKIRREHGLRASVSSAPISCSAGTRRRPISLVRSE